MVTENIESADDIPEGATAHVGDRGGLSYDTFDHQHNIISNQINTNNGKPPTYILIGPGVDMAFFRSGGGFNIKYKGPYCEEAISLAKSMATSGSKFKEIIDEICKEFNCKIVNEGEKI